ncbi:VacJ family lipoprotein [Endozoicomonas sp. SM1973]|uniref:VacJ family lipoprotein n=1 Tax=Spartinivicinus marinus TaxID=2994442 RepID=A0A853IB32_9GAMM|nr:VacJ family lipoprotein [Spartinivicinus marinus]MCX4027817.1 VacJ family lipoprotein [Spartinivicinus marinus]NYZ69042.1 VacJ family lipoprotein [Spartinivicinus marinus]
MGVWLFVSIHCLAAERENPIESLDFWGNEAREATIKDINFIDAYDPLEPANRILYKFNRQFDENVYLPVVSTYEYLIPEFIQDRVSKVLDNVSEVANIVNNGLQFNLKGTLYSSGRLLINTTAGILGAFDVASYIGMQRHNADFGHTLAFYGVNDGAYIVLPILGPTNLRDMAGLIVDSFLLNQVNWLTIPRTTVSHPAVFALNAIDRRHQIPFRYGSLDSPFEYDMVRYLYRQSRMLKLEVNALSEQREH